MSNWIWFRLDQMEGISEMLDKELEDIRRGKTKNK
jgi:hypothetical protein